MTDHRNTLPFSHPVTRAAAEIGSRGTWGAEANQLVICKDDRTRLLLQVMLVEWVRDHGHYCHVQGGRCVLPKGYVQFGGEPESGPVTVVNHKDLRA